MLSKKLFIIYLFIIIGAVFFPFKNTFAVLGIFQCFCLNGDVDNLRCTIGEDDLDLADRCKTHCIDDVGSDFRSSESCIPEPGGGPPNVCGDPTKCEAGEDPAICAECAKVIGPTGATPWINNPLGTASVVDLVARVVNGGLLLLGAGAFAMFVWGGGSMLLSAGDSKMVETGRKTLAYASIGLVIIFTSYAILRFVFSVVQGA